jgi:thiamine kinase-like enzyme
MAKPEIMRRVAAAMADLHRYEIPLELKPFYQTPGMWDQLWSWFEQAKQALGNQRSGGPGGGALAKWGEEVVEQYGKIEAKFLGDDFTMARGELQMLSDLMEQGETLPIVFAHNDLLAGNIIPTSPLTTPHLATLPPIHYHPPHFTPLTTIIPTSLLTILSPPLSPRPSLLTPRSSPPHPSLLAPRLLTPLSSPLSPHHSLLTPLSSPLASSPLSPRPSPPHPSLLTSGNIMAHQESGAVVLIDFEYGGCNYRGFDIANHWNEWAGGTQVEMNGRTEYERFPTEQQQLDFCRAYLDQLGGELHDSTASADSPDSAEALVKEARMFVLANHWY